MCRISPSGELMLYGSIGDWADELTADDVLRKLGMRAGGRSDRCGTALAEDRDALLLRIAEELFLGDAKNALVGTILTDDTFDQFREGNRAHDVSHTHS